MSTRTGRAVWSFAAAVNRLPWVCWPDMVTWALGLTHWRDERKPLHRLIAGSLRDLAAIVSDRRQADRCKRDALPCGACYCGKFQSAAFQREHVPAHCKPGILVDGEAKP